MKIHATLPVVSRGLRLGLGVCLLTAMGSSASAQPLGNVFSNLQVLVQRLHVGVPANSPHGPKGIARANFDQDSYEDLATANTDGSVTLFFGRGEGRFTQPMNLASGAGRLRGIVAADLDGDGSPDLAVTAPFDERIVVFLNRGSRQFSRTNVPAWPGVRNLATGDFDGDGHVDLVAAGPNNGMRQYRWLNGTLMEVTNVFEVSIETPKVGSRFPKPVYSMKSFRPPGSTKDHLALTHADTDRVWLLSPDAVGALQVTSSITNQATAHALDVGRLFHTNASTTSPLDLVTVLRDAGTLIIRPGTNLQSTGQRIDVPGGPRAVEIVDLNGDGWNDLVVVVRNFDSVVTYANSNGTFRLATERPVGSSPRELVTGFFDNDQFPDLAVMNRDSADVSLLMAHPNSVGYRGVNHLYLVDGNVVGLIVRDFNHDWRDDVIQLHRASGDFSVRLANLDGTLQPPVFYTVGNVPSAQVLAFVNRDPGSNQIPDLITANLGTTGIKKGSVTVCLGIADSQGQPDGTFGPSREYQLGEGITGRLFALVPADFDGDGNIDLAAGFLDSRIAFLRGAPDGSFTHVRTHQFVNQARGMVAADFDKDGDLDLACVGLSGEMWVIRNPGAPANEDTNLMLETQLTDYIHSYPAPSPDSFGGRRILVLDNDRDSNLDLIVGSGRGAWFYRGNGDGSLVMPHEKLAGTDQFVSDLLPLDLDKDGNPDQLVVSCRGRDCLSVFSRTNQGNFGVALNLDAPASKFIAAGDLDGDGETDLVGTGRVLWTALSGSVPADTPPLQLSGQRPRLTNAVINEILAINTALPVESDGDRMVEWVEIYNGGARQLPQTGWRLQSIGPDENSIERTNAYDLPSTLFVSTNGRVLIIFSDRPPGGYNTGFRLPGDGGTLTLLRSNVVVDQVKYPPQRPNISYARFRDGLPAFGFNPFPSPQKPNVFNGQVEPDVKFRGVDPATWFPNMTNRFFADVSDDVGVSSLTMYYQRLAGQFPENQQLRFSDDGEHGDGDISDGRFSADLPPVLPGGSELQFYLEVVDLNDNVALFPDEPEFALAPGEAGNAYQLGIGFTNPPIEISELVALNDGGLLDESNGHPDWIEVRNISSAPVSLTNMVLAQQVGDNARYHFPPGTVLAPGEHFVVFCDNNPEHGPRHAPFRLSSGGETVMLTGLTTNNSRTVIDWVDYGPLEANVSWARLGAGGAWRRNTPTPYSANVAASWLGCVETNESGAVFTFAFPTEPDATYTLEHAPNLEAGTTWSELETIAGDGIEKVIRRPLEGSGFFRVRKSP